MALSLNHFSIRTTELEATERFFCDVVGLVAGPRPPFPFPGRWLYAGDTSSWANAAVHLIGIDRQAPAGLSNYLGDRDEASLRGTGALDHVAFFATGLAATRQRLAAHGVVGRERTVPLIGLHQVFIDDPNGLVVELNFPAAEAATT